MYFLVFNSISSCPRLFDLSSLFGTLVSKSGPFYCVQLPECLRIVAHLRRIGVFSESELRLQVF